VTRPGVRLSALLAASTLLAACRLDVAVSMEMAVDGTGTVTIVATADDEVVDEVPDLAEILSLRDARSAGWEVRGPRPTEDGGMTITISHGFRDADEATAVLSSLGGPFDSMAVTRRVDGAGVEASATNTLGGTLVLLRGFASFADQRLIETAGGVPFADRLEGHTPESTMAVTFSARLPGNVTAANGGRDDGVVSWDVPLDGATQPVELVSVQAAPEQNTWAGPLSTAALVALVAWLAVAVVFVGYVIVARRRRSALRGR
jgi:hypothetical protein